jgi:hypothetical protein
MSTVAWIVIAVGALVIVAVIAAVVRARGPVRDAERLQAQELRQVGEKHLAKADREHEAALDAVADAEVERIKAADRLVAAQAEIDEADRLDPDA